MVGWAETKDGFGEFVVDKETCRPECVCRPAAYICLTMVVKSFQYVLSHTSLSCTVTVATVTHGDSL